MELAIREARKAAGLRVSELAQKLGTSTANLSRWEREPQRVNLVTLDKIAKALNVAPASLIVARGHAPVANTGGSSEALVIAVKSLQSGVPDFPFERNYLSTLTDRPANELLIAIVQDDAMFPTLRHGDALLIEPYAKAERPGLYASVQADNNVLVRRVMPGLEAGQISIMTDNKDYPDFPDVEASRFPVSGKVIWIGRSLL